MLVELKPFPRSPPSPVERIEVGVRRIDGLTLHYRVHGDLERVRLPEFADPPPGRTDELWRHTCFEAFVQPTNREDYLELNATTSMAWATYRFDGYREGMRPANVEPSALQGVLPPRGLELQVVFDPGRLPRPDLAAPDLRLGLSAVIEDIDGTKTYWALAHPSDKPDFHHPDSFTLVLPAAEQT